MIERSERERERNVLYRHVLQSPYSEKNDTLQSKYYFLDISKSKKKQTKFFSQCLFRRTTR